MVVGAGLIGIRAVPLSSSSPGKTGRSSQKRFGFCQKMQTDWSRVGARVSSIKARNVLVLEQRVKYQPAFSGGGYSLIFWLGFP